MTDKEMAEEYAKSIVIFDRDFHNDRFAEIEQAFLAGLKAGRPKWHKVADGDLPIEHEYVLVYTDLANYYVSERVNDHFMTKGFGFIPMSTVIAWCEIPKYTKE